MQKDQSYESTIAGSAPDLANGEFKMSQDKTFIYVNNRRISLAALMVMARDEIRTVYASGCTGLTALPDLPNATIKTTLPGEKYFFAGVDSRGYSFEGIIVRGQWRVIAGCRNFSIADACKHWGLGGESDRPDCLALVEKIAATATEKEKINFESASAS